MLIKDLKYRVNKTKDMLVNKIYEVSSHAMSLLETLSWSSNCCVRQSTVGNGRPSQSSKLILLESSFEGQNMGILIQFACMFYPIAN